MSAYKFLGRQLHFRVETVSNIVKSCYPTMMKSLEYHTTLVKHRGHGRRCAAALRPGLRVPARSAGRVPLIQAADSRHERVPFCPPPPAPPDQNTTTSGATAPKMPRMMPIAPSTQANRSSIFADVITDAVDSTMPSSSAAAALS